MIPLLPAAVIFIFFVFLFFRQDRLDQKKWAEADRLGDEHIMREIERFKQQIGHDRLK